MPSTLDRPLPSPAWGGLALAICSGLLSACASFPSLPCPMPRSAVDPSRSVDFTITNDTCRTICDINIAPAACDNWGPDDWIAEGNLFPGDHAVVRVPVGKVEIRVMDCTEDEYFTPTIDAAKVQAHVIHDSRERSASECTASLTVRNNTEVPICHMWIATETSERFGYNWLGHEQIAVGAERTFVLPAGSYDVKAEDCGFDQLRLELDLAITAPTIWTVP